MVFEGESTVLAAGTLEVRDQRHLGAFHFSCRVVQNKVITLGSLTSPAGMLGCKLAFRAALALALPKIVLEHAWWALNTLAYAARNTLVLAQWTSIALFKNSSHTATLVARTRAVLVRVLALCTLRAFFFLGHR